MIRKQLTEREKLVIEYAALSGKVETLRYYCAAFDGAVSALEGSASLPSRASHWWASDRVQEYYQEKKRTAEARRVVEKDRITAAIRAEIQREAYATPGGLDFSDPRLQISKLNEIIANGDINTQLDAIKILISKGANVAKDGGKVEQVRRFYTPVKCHSCPLYAEEKKRIEIINNK